MAKLRWRRRQWHGVDKAVRLFEAGSVEDAARLLRQERKKAEAGGRDDVRADIDETVLQMRAYLNREERKTFDALFKPQDLAEETDWRTALGTSLLAPFAAAYIVLYYLAGYALAIFVALPLYIVQQVLSVGGREPRTLRAKAAVDAWLEKWFEDPL